MTNPPPIHATPLDFAVIFIYFVVILGFGAWFSRYTRSTKDFFFGGQRFTWWLIAMSCVATVVGSYSFMKYSAAGFTYGMSSSMTYLNDWIILPFFVLGWFPIIYFTRVTSIPEYLERRFDRRTSIVALVLILIYMMGYIGINFYTLGVALQPLLNVNIYVIVVVIAIVSAIYMHAGGQTSVIMTDLIQGFVLLSAGFVVLFLGIQELGGVEAFLRSLPPDHRLPLAAFNSPPKFNFVGIFWQDALASSVAFYFMNQGVMMRFMSVKSPDDGYKAIFAVVVVLMPLACVAIANSGWIGRAMVTQGMISPDTDPNTIFIVVASRITRPGVFGLILAALTAALMSTIDTLITAVCAIWVNDIWKPYIAPHREDSYYLSVARATSIWASVLGVLLVPIFAREESIYVAHGKFIATVTPPMITVILLSVFWKRFTAPAAFWTLIIGSALTAVSAYYPDIIAPIAHGVSPEGGFKFMRAFFGIVTSLILAVSISMCTRPKDDASLVGLVIDTIEDAKTSFKGGVVNEDPPGSVVKVTMSVQKVEGIGLSQKDLNVLSARIGDLAYVSDSRWYFGGLRSIHTRIGFVHEEEGVIHLSPSDVDDGHFDTSPTLTVEKIL